MRFPRSSLLAVTQTALWALILTSARASAADSALLHNLQACPDQAFAGTGGGPAPAPRRGSYSREQPIQVSSNNASVAIAGDATVNGQVTVTQGDRELTADNVRVDKLHDSIEIDGNVTYRDPDLSVQGRTGRYEAGAAQINDAQFQMLQQASRGRAGALRLDEQGVLHLDEVTYTTCPTGNSDWQIDAAAVRLDNAKHKGVARKARVRFKGVPLVYLPWL
jgi:LPS-assembly protein